MKKVITLFVLLFFFSWMVQAQPAFTQLVAAANNNFATVTFDSPVGGNPGLSDALLPTDFTVTVTASGGGGSVAAGTVTLTSVTHTANTNSAVLNFTIAGTADGSEIIKVKPSAGNVIYNAGGGMDASAEITQNLNDKLAPNTPSTPTFASADDTGILGDGRTKNTTALTFSGGNGSVEANASVQLFDGISAVGTPTTANSSGAWSKDLSLSAGSHLINAKATDAASNVSLASLDFALTIDTSPPTLVSITPIESPSRGLVFRSENITASTLSNIVTGSGFNANLFVGAKIRTTADVAVGTVLTVDNDTQVTLTTFASANVDGPYAIRYYFTATFSEPMDVSTVTGADFDEVGIGTEDTTEPVTAGGASTSFRINVSSLYDENGSTVINLNNSGVTDAAGNSLTANISGTTATIDNTGPIVSSIVRTTPAQAYTKATSVTYTVTFDEPVTGVDATVFTKTITGAGFTAGAISVNPISSTVYEVSVADIATVQGTLKVNIPANPNIKDGLGNAFVTAFTTGDLYTFDYTNPAQPAVYNAVTTRGNVVADYWNGTNLGGTNQGVNLSIAIPNDPSLAGGTIQVQARISSGTFAAITTVTSLAIAQGDLGTTKIITIDDSQILLIAGYAQTVSLQFQVRFVDLTSNAGTYRQSTNSLTVDTTAPSIVGTPVYAANGSSRETIVITFNESLAITNGALPVTTTTQGDPGFYSDDPAIRANNDATIYTSADKTITLSSNSNNQWTDPANQTITYTSNVGVAGNYVRDAAGNEMATQDITTTIPAPLLSSSMVLNPNGINGEIITFTVDQALTTPTTDNGVVGILVNGVSPGLTFTATYSTANSLNTIILVATFNNTWDETAIVSYVGAAGNIQNSAGDLAAFSEPILVGPISIESENDNNTALAKVDDPIIVSFRINKPLLDLSEPPTATIGTLPAVVAIDGAYPNYTATVTATNVISDGPVIFSIVVLETGRTTTVNTTIPGSSVLFDKIRPTVTVNDNHPDNIVRDADLVRITATFIDANGIDETTPPKISIGSLVINAAMVKINNLQWYYDWDVPSGSINDGDVSVTISATDPAGNPNETATAVPVTGTLTYTIDNTPPEVTIAITTPPVPLGFGANSTSEAVVNFLLTFDQSIPSTVAPIDITVNTDSDVDIFDGYPGITYTNLSVTGSGTTRTVTLTGLTGTGRIKINFIDSDNNVTDVAGNPVVDNTTTYTTNQYYTRVLPAPSDPVSSIAVSRTETTMTVNWTDAVGPAQQATHYLVMIKKTTQPSFPVPADGTYINNDTNISDDNYQRLNVTLGATSALFSNLSASENYDVIIYPYTLSPNNSQTNINFGQDKSTQVSASSSIVQNFDYSGNDNILYKDFTTAALTSSSKTLEQFELRDGGGIADGDNLPTILTGITLNINNWENLNTLGLFNGTNLVQQINVTSATAVFNSIGTTFQAADGTTPATITVKGSFKTIVDDNEVVTFNVTSVTASALNSSQFLTTTPTGPTVASDASGTQNKIEVVATKIDFTTVPASASISVPFTVQVSALDANNNLDVDYNGPITDTGNTNEANFTTINDPTGNFLGGIKDYPVNFQFTEGNGSVSLTITGDDGNLANNVDASGPISGTSPVINVISSFESVIVSSDLYNGTSYDINYIDYQDADITGTTLVNTNGFKLDLLYLADGGWDVVDADGAPTILDDLTLGISNPESIQKIAIYHQPNINNPAITEIQELDNSNIVVIDGYGQITFTNLNITSADDTYTGVVVLVTFNNSAATIQDRDLVQVSVIDATLNPGSKFAPDAAETGTIGGEPVNNVTFPPEASTVQRGSWGPNNYIQAVATSLDFVTQPSVYAGIDEPIDGSVGTSPGGSTGIVHSRDQFGVLDTDFAYPATVTAVATPKLYPTNFTAGVLNLSTMQYDIAGLGALTVSSNGLSSDNELWATSDKGDPVDVIHVTASLPQNPNNGVVTSPSLKGGTSNIVIFGFDIYPTYSTALQPELNQFSITFDVPYQTTGTTILKDFKVFESLVGTFAGSANVVSFGASVTEGQSPTLIAASAPLATKDMITVNFPTPRSLKNRGPGNPITYFLVVNIDATANLTTPKITPQLLDGGYGSPDNGHILTSIGSSSADVKGTQFGFASTRPPSLVASEPKNGALNVDPNQNTIKLYFDVGVWSHDQYILLWERYSNTLVDTLKLTGSYGAYPNAVSDPKATPPIPLTFSIPDPSKLIADSVYYITIAKGTFDPNTKTGTGISDDGFNLYGGLSFNGGLYFKMASKNPPVMISTDPNKYYPSATGGSINASFDQKEGTAYYMVVNQGGPPPTSAMIKGTALYGGTVQARGNFTIDQVNPNVNAGVFNVAPDLVDRTFDVWMYAENGAPAKVPSGPYGNEANDYLENTTGPTFSIVIPKATSSVFLNKPAFQICANSDVTLTEPIIIEESTLRSEFNSAISGEPQNFNLLLPSGFTFDVSTIPNIQSSGGADFTGGGAFSYQYVNSTILKITFKNSGNSSQDKIVISNLKVRASASDLSGSIIRFAGNAFPSATTTLGDGIAFATIASGNIAALDFSNSYTTSNNFDAAPITITNPVTAIPDNYVDPDTKLGPFAVRLSPIVPKGDYGPSTFSGNGVTNDVLSLSGVPLNTAFDITMTHVDLNGCVSEQVVQYEVYDHKQAIPALVDSTYGIKDYIVNPNYLMNQPPPPFSNVADSVSRNFKAGYSMIELFANIPTRATARDSVNLANNTATSQIMFGPAWQALVSQIPIKKDSSDFNTTLGEYYRSYYYYYGPLMPLDPALDPYKYYDDFTPEGRKYYRGGSLGQIEFTGKFRSTADATILTPIRQEIEVFIPAIPVIEILDNAISGFDITDPLRPDPVAWPKGTPIFCQSGTSITINGYPAATPGVSAGRFDIVDATNPLDTLYSSKIESKRYGGFIDNLNGTAILNPGALKNQNGEIANAYKDIRIVYTFKDDASPIEGSGNLVIRITPNPVANFTTSNLCEDIDVFFTDQSSLAPGSGASIARALWSFADNKANAKENADTVNYPSARIPFHKYPDPVNYPGVGLTVITNFGCSSTTPTSPQFTKNLSIGGTPQVKFDFRGVSTADPIDFVSTSTVENDVIITEDWDFGDLSVIESGNIVSHTYSASSTYDVNLTVTSQKGCFNDSTRQVVILPRVIVSDLNVYSENFETTNGGWIFFPTNATWQWTTATKSVIKNDANLNGQKVWITNNDGTYDRESYLYTASYDISALSRPMISFNTYVQMGSGDGVVIEFSTDNKNASDPTKEWNRLGTNETGINWYNGQGLPSNPGNQLGGDYGWASAISAWQESKHSLSVDNLTSPEQKGKVVFRFALASVSARNPDGFALDNVRIGDRTRTVLIENFTNKGGPNASEKQVSDNLRSFPGSVGIDIVKINYHVGFPGPEADPFNAINPADPSARALFYNIVKTPTTYMDGLTEKSDPLFTQWAQSKYDSQSLNLAGADIAIAQTLSSTTGAYSVEVSVLAKKQLPANTVLHVAFLEQEISLANNLPTGENKFEYVLKKLLPSGAGIRFNEVLNENQTRTFTGLEWSPDTKNLFAPSNDLVIVAFLQNETTLEVYQSELIAGINDPPVVTGIGDILPELVNVYPNPASSEFRVELPAFVQNEASIHLIDFMGRSHDVGKIKAGSNAATVNVESLSEGIYILEIGSDNTGIIRKKVMVVMKN